MRVVSEKIRSEIDPEDFPLGDAAWVVAHYRRTPPRPYNNLLDVECRCGSKLPRVGHHCALCHTTFVDDYGFEQHMSAEGCAVVEASTEYVLTRWGGWRWNYQANEGMVWILGNHWGTEEDAEYVADYVSPIPRQVVHHLAI